MPVRLHQEKYRKPHGASRSPKLNLVLEKKKTDKILSSVKNT